jgi:serine/threonine protein kinase
MYKISHSKKLKKVYFKLIGRDFYYFKNKEDTSHKGMHNLSGIYIKPGDKVIIEGKSFFTFSILYPQKARTYYIEDENEYKEWLNKLHLSIDYKNLLDLYEIKEKTGKGKFGLVKHAIHKETGKEVAIKIMSKKLNNDLELTKTEIDILKICHHPNIIKLYDIFDTADYIYIIMEYCAGGDLFSYIEKRNYKLPEPRAAQIIHKLSMAIFYIHSYGIIHRDLKPENILMTDESDNADIRLLDFGLSKIIGPNEKCTEPFGTLSFVAPEVLKGKPYDKSVDLWSIGIIAYLLMCGFLPFDDEHSEREIARQTIQDPVPYPSNIWKNLSPEAKEFVGSLLKKNPEERIGIKEVLNSKWIRKFVDVPAERDIMNENDNTNHKSHFEAFSTDKNMK